jgi:hypothetical protein
MAVSVDTVYRTVLLIINKEQRGNLTPDEFNRTAAQVQLEIFNEYFEDLNQVLRVQGNDSEYTDRIKSLEEKIAFFHSYGNCAFSVDHFTTPDAANFYKIGTVIYKDEKEVQYVQPNELLEMMLSPIVKPSIYWPVYEYKNSKIYVYPKTINSDISCTYIKKPLNPVWNFSLGPNNQYVYNPSTSQDFQLHPIEQTNLITRILLYSGIVISDQQIVSIAAQQIQAENINSKS